MAQAGIHGIAGVSVGRWAPKREWLALGIVLGNMVPDADNLAVAVATLAGLPTTGLHRTFTHSLFFVVAVVLGFALISRLRNQPRWGNLGLGLGGGVVMHILLDLLVWFDGVEILWPVPSWVNLWANVTPPEWWSKLMMPAEFLCFALLFWLLGRAARRQGTDSGYLRTLRVWTMVQAVLWVVFTALVYTMGPGFMTPFGALYLASLALAVGVVLRMRRTVESAYG